MSATGTVKSWSTGCANVASWFSPRWRAMTMRMAPRFWKALDDIPGAASDGRDWKTRLGEEFEAVSRYLRRTGEIATSVDCPSPGGDGCPRRVVRLRGGI